MDKDAVNLDELYEDEKIINDRFQQMLKEMRKPKNVSQNDILDSLLKDEEMQQILFSRKYVFYRGRIIPLDPNLISASLNHDDFSDDDLEKMLSLDGNYRIVYERNKAIKIKNALKEGLYTLKNIILFPFELVAYLFDALVDFLFRHGRNHIFVAVHEGRKWTYKIRSGEEKEINCDDLDIKALLKAYNSFDSELKSVPAVFSKALEYHMDYRGVSGAQLADITGIAASTISRMLNEDSEEVPNHKLKSIVAICIALKLPPVMSYNLIDLAGCRLLNNKKDRIYTMLLNYFYDKDIEYCDTVLEKLGVKGLKIY